MKRILPFFLTMFLVSCSSYRDEELKVVQNVDITQKTSIGITTNVGSSGNSSTSGAAGTATVGKEVGGVTVTTGGTGTAFGFVGIAVLGALAPPTLLVSVPLSAAIVASGENNDTTKKNNVYYSYVLTGKSLQGSRSRIVYDLLISDIKSRYPDLSDNRSYPIPKNTDVNLYVIPQKVTGETDYQLSSYIVNVLATIHSEPFSSSGPFVVTTSKQLNTTDINDDVDIPVIIEDA